MTLICFFFWGVYFVLLTITIYAIVQVVKLDFETKDFWDESDLALALFRKQW